MGGVISTASDFVVNQVCSYFFLEANHICSLDKNLEALEKEMVKLKAKRDDVLRSVKREEDQGLQRLSGVQVWLTAVESIENQAHETHMACTIELQGLSVCDGCSRKLESRFRYGNEVFSMLKDVNELILTGDFKAVAAPPMRDVVEERALQRIIVGQEKMLARAWDHLMDDGTQIMGIHGMGGVGKTTLLDQINNHFCGADNGVEVVIWVVVSKDKRNEKIQDEIAEKLGFRTGGESWKQKTETQKASAIRISMKSKRFVLLLDDLWSKVELKAIGVPFPTRENKSKVVFTTRSREVCRRMEADDQIEIKCLDSDDAWVLFKKKVGEDTLRSHSDIPELAGKVAEKCCGLPLALSVIGETMSFRDTVQEWRHAVDTLTSSAAEFTEMKDEILPILKYSYDSLKKKHVKPCFLYCSLFPEDFEIRKDVLIEYWISEELIRDNQSREKALNEGYDILSTLVRACLLLEESIYTVKMHDVVREMALWVASDLGEHKGRYTVQAGVGLRQIPETVDWRTVRRMSLMKNEIEELSVTPYSPELTTLLLQENKLACISSEFFRSMPGLRVLDLSNNSNLSGLPEEISELAALRYLDLSHTKIERLPVGLQKLKMLIHLNLEYTVWLKSISGISNLSRLRRLGLRHSGTMLDMNLLKELQLLKYLEVVTIVIRSSVVAEQLKSYHGVVKCISKVEFKDIQQESFRILTLPTMDNLCDLEIEKCGMREIKTEGVASSWNKSPTSPSFLNLSTLCIAYCKRLKDLTWLLYAPNLTVLTVGRSTQLEYIISEEKAAACVMEESGIIIPFRKLERISFYDLPRLKSIYRSPLPFPCLRGIGISGCEQLRKLPLDSTSVAQIEGFVIESVQRFWIASIEWEDHATKLRFESSCKQFD